MIYFLFSSFLFIVFYFRNAIVFWVIGLVPRLFLLRTGTLDDGQHC